MNDTSWGLVVLVHWLVRAACPQVLPLDGQVPHITWESCIFKYEVLDPIPGDTNLDLVRIRTLKQLPR